MPHTYQQTTGVWLDPTGEVLGTGYSGHPPHVNDPDAQNIPCVGPIPQGDWTIGPAYYLATKGPLVMSLTPHSDTVTFGRSGFLIHGDAVEFPGQEEASLGCIIMPRDVREAIDASADHQLVVQA
jgi:hypothetical protein